MGIMENILTEQIVQKLGWTLLHSLWQGVVIVLLLAVCLRVLRKSSANLRYLFACLGLVVIVLVPVVTFFMIPTPAPTSEVVSFSSFPAPVTEKSYEVYDTDMPLQRAAEYMQISHTISWKQRVVNFYESALPYIVFGWFVGVLALCLWHLGGWVHLQCLRRQKVNHVDKSLNGKLRNLAARLKVGRPVKLLKSVLVQTPTVAGWLRPVILMPACALSGLSPEQLEALLAHELAHIRRCDYLVNIFQTVVEILGFYHPAVWWISHQIRLERENCCDDLAVSVCGDKVAYARALISMEEARFAQGELAVAATGGSLSRRIRRLFGTGSAENDSLGYVPVVISILLIMALMIPTTLALTAKRENKDSNPVSPTKSDCIKTIDADLAKTATKAQILVKCQIFEVPVDLKFLESERKKVTVGRVVLIGSESAEALELLSEQNQYVKVIAAPQLMVLDGKEAVIKSSSGIPYITGYLPSDEDGENPKPITKMASEDMEVRVKVRVTDSGAIQTEIRLIQSKPSLTTKKDSQGREIQTPIIENSGCTADVVARSGESIIIGGLSSYAGPSRSLILMITPSIVCLEEGSEPAKIEMETSAVGSDPGHVDELRAAEVEKIDADQRLAELQSLLKQKEYLKKALENQALELQQKLHEIQMKLVELETKKAGFAELKRLGSLLDSLKEPESEHERLAAIAAKFAEMGDFAKAIEFIEKAIELAKTEKDYGIGIAIEKVDSLIRISQVLPDTPASGSSFRPGDIIKAVDGVSTEGMSLDEVVARITGPKDTEVTLTVKCHSQDITMEETFTRQVLLQGSPALQQYQQRLDAYKAGKTWPQYRQMMEGYKPWQEEAVRVYKLKYANPEELAELLNRIFERRWRGIKDKPAQVVKIMPDQSHKKLVILASPADIRLLEALIAELDVLSKQDTAVLKAAPDTEYKQDQAAESTITQVINLKYADCGRVEQILMQLLSDKRLRIAADKRTNMLIVAGTKSAIEEIKALVAQIDVPAPDKNLEIETPEKQEKKEY